MVLVDPRDGPNKEPDLSGQMVSEIRRIGVMSQKSMLPSADFAFDGNGPQGDITVGVERKTLHDMLNCIEDGRYNMQRIKMKNMYGARFLIVEGVWTVHRDNGFLMEQRVNQQGKAFWDYCRQRSTPVLYSKLHNYLISVGLSGVVTTLTRDLHHTCYSVCEMFHYFQKQWHQHTSLMEKQVLNIPALNGKPPLVRRWASELDGIGVKYGEEAARRFRTPIKLATADETEWIAIDGIGPTTARRIVRQIGGYER